MIHYTVMGLRTLAMLSLSLTLAAQGLLVMKTTKGNVELYIEGIEPSSIKSTVNGYLRNRSGVDFLFLRFELICLDQDGNQLNVCERIERGCTLFSDRIPRNGTRRLASPGNTIFPDGVIPKGRRISTFVARMIEASYSPEYVFDVSAKENPNFDISFQIDPETGISFIMKNKLDSAIEIIWDQSSFINERDEASRLVHANVKYNDKDRPQPNTIIPPLAKITETVFPSGNIQFVSDRWSKQPLLPFSFGLDEDASVLDSLIGKSLKLFLRILVQDKKVDYVVSFQIKAINH